ncbi:MAG: T9SS type A sorting domain-containing protein [Bacteroidetes bacterium]|nr:T9SS type A sorting domain-containing protein [Bacteroidota bacterium]
MNLLILEAYRLNKGETTILNDDLKFSVWPNPTNGKITIEVSNYSMGTKLEIVNTLGQVVFNSEVLNYTNEFDFSSMNSGIYFVKLHHNGNVSTTKIVKQ